MKRRVTTESHVVVFQSEVKVTQETENQASPLETRSGASAVASRIRLAEDSEELGTRVPEDGFHASIFKVESKSQDLKIFAPAVTVPLRIEGVDFQMEVYTGAAASIMSYTDYAPYFEYLALRPVNKSFHAYTGTPLDIAGQILVDVEYNGQKLTLPSLFSG